jgi:hypothetical protein
VTNFEFTAEIDIVATRLMATTGRIAARIEIRRDIEMIFTVGIDLYL